MTNPYRERNRDRVEDLTSNIQLNYDKKFGKHAINVVAGFEATKRNRPKMWIHSTPTSDAMDLIRLNEIVEFNDTGKGTEARMGYLARVNYNYADRYLVDLLVVGMDHGNSVQVIVGAFSLLLH